MKNKNLLRVFGIMIGVVFLLTWIIPASTTGTSGLELGAITPVGFADIFSSLEIILYYFAKPAILILLIGMFYGVINKTGVYKALVDKIVKIFKSERVLFVIFTVIFYSVIAALNGIYLPIFMFIPLSIAVLLELKYSKVQSLLATVGASTIGLTAQISSSIFKSVTGVKTNTFLWIKAGLLVVLIALVILYILKSGQKKGKENKEENNEGMFVPEKRVAKLDKKPNGLSLFIVLCLLCVVFILGLTAWTNAEVFTNVYTSIKNVKIGSFAVFASILGAFETFGSWTLNSVYSTIGLAIIVMAICGRLSFSEVIESCIEGAKKVVGVAFLSALISLVVIFTLNSGFLSTIINFIAKSGNIALVTLSSLVTSPFMVEQGYAAQYITQMIYTITSNDEMLELYGLIVQVTYGFTMLIAPSSVLLMISLYYLGESYTKWFKYIWKLLVVILVACLMAIVIATLI